MTYVPDGHPRRVRYGDHDLDYVYDEAGRLTGIQDHDSEQWWKEWQWGSENVGGGCAAHTPDCDYQRGKVVEAVRYNHPCPCGKRAQG